MHSLSVTAFLPMLFGGLFAGLILAGCQAYQDPNKRTIGEFTDDVAIQTAVKSRLIGNREIKGLRINVEVRKGIVTLLGRVPTQETRQLAVRLSQGVKGVKRVEDRLTLVTD